VGPLEQRTPQYNSVWGYSTDNGLGFLEYLQLCEDLDAEPIWVVNAGIAIAEEVPTDTHEAFTSGISPYVQDVLDGIEVRSCAELYNQGYSAKLFVGLGSASAGFG
jgi:alpha-N-arabinofuranosidase